VDAAKRAQVIPLARPHPQARYFIPEVVQTSVMDCGPAALQALVEGFGISVNYGRLREACQTSVDGTSISTMDEVANFLGLVTEETMLPIDHLLISEAHALPAIVVVKNPNGANHFVVVWSISGPWVQVMDPAQGRHWIRRSALIDRLYIHHQRVPASAWRRWVAEREFLDTLDTRLAGLAIARVDRDRLCATALASPGWEEMSALDAATRMTASLVANGAVSPGPLCLALIERQVERGADGAYSLLPLEYQSAWLSRVRDGDQEEMLRLRGVVLVRARGRRDIPRAAPAGRSFAVVDEAGVSAGPAGRSIEASREPTEAAGGTADAVELPPELAAALTEESVRPWRTLLRLLVSDGLATPVVLCIALVVSAMMVTGNAILLRGILEVGQQLGLPTQRAAAMTALVGFLALGLLVEIPVIAGALSLGRTLELRLRMSFLTKIPRLDDRYFRSRLLSDMAERGHTLHLVRNLPLLGVRLLSASAQLLLTVAGIAWLQPASAPLALMAAVVCIGVPLACQPLMAERDLRLRSHAGALGRFYLDALLGLLPIRVHGARAAMQRQQDALLVQWARAGFRFHTASTMVEGALALCGFGMAAVMVWSVSRHSAGGLLLLVYWALSLPALGQDIAIVARQYPVLRNVVLRLLEPLGAPEPAEPAHPASAWRSTAVLADADRGAELRGVAIRMSGVSVEAAGDTLLQAVDLDVGSGEHIAIVGPSGAGKSTLVGLLLGWYRPARGRLEVDGRPLVGEWLNSLRQSTAWVDPAVTLWNRSFLDNLRYGADDDAAVPLAEILSAADLREVLERLPDGLATELGEGGAMISGGEGQRTRVGRALARNRARLVILDEPFRGLDLTTRRQLLATVRAWWRDATLLWVTHDIAETEAFDRVLVIDEGRVVEDDAPSRLDNRPGSRYTALVRGDRHMHDMEWSRTNWRRVWVERGKLREEGTDS
jgi:ABC-type bacteriocin/lantibiotic exporter with double-glycine peptidase domain